MESARYCKNWTPIRHVTVLFSNRTNAMVRTELLLNTPIIGPSAKTVASSWIDMLAGLSGLYIRNIPPCFCANAASAAASAVSKCCCCCREPAQIPLHICPTLPWSQKGLEFGADLLRDCGNSLCVAGLCSPIQLQLVAAVAWQYVNMKMRHRLLSAGPVRLDEIQSHRR